LSDGFLKEIEVGRRLLKEILLKKRILEKVSETSPNGTFRTTEEIATIFKKRF
jgi:hypothetical protein